MDSETSEAPQAGRGSFCTTHWSVVVAAGGKPDPSQTALEKLCHAYWEPLYAYVRRRGFSVDDAQDLTQSFFARLLEKRWLACAEQAKGRFRTFLLTAMERFIANEWDKARALKRGGGQLGVPIQLESAETRYGVDPPDLRTPEQAFEYRWALTLLDQVVTRLEDEFREHGQGDLFRALKPCLVGDGQGIAYSELAAKLKMGRAH